jgi:hypothetical protein
MKFACGAAFLMVLWTSALCVGQSTSTQVVRTTSSRLLFDLIQQVNQKYGAVISYGYLLESN